MSGRSAEDTLSTDDITESDVLDQLDVQLNQNPVDQYLEFIVNFPSDDNLLIELYDINGKFIKRLSRDIILQKTQKSYRFDVSDLSSGLYFLDFHNNSGRSSLKFVKN